MTPTFERKRQEPTWEDRAGSAAAGMMVGGLVYLGAWLSVLVARTAAFAVAWAIDTAGGQRPVLAALVACGAVFGWRMAGE